MERTEYVLSGGLRNDEIEKIVADAFDLLENSGVAVEDAEVREELAKRKGVRVEGENVHYLPPLVEDLISQVKKQNDEYMLNDPSRSGWLVRPPFLCMRVWDLDADAARPATSEDARRASRLLDSYGAEGIPPVHPLDIPVTLRQVATAKIAYDNSRSLGAHMQATTIREAELLSELGRAAGRPGPHVSLQVVHSPLRLDANSLRLLLEMKRANRTPPGVSSGGGAMPLAGAVAPLLNPGFLAQGLAEAISAYGTGKMINEKTTGYCSLFPGTFDMRFSGMSMASPEAVLYWLAIRQLFHRVFGQTMGGDFACMGKTYDPQAAAEKMAAILTAVLSGANTFVNAGMTPSDEVFHFEGVVIDLEILAYAWRIGRGLAWEDAPTREIVESGRAAGTFLMHDTTMRYREEIWDPVLFTNEGHNQWLAEGSPALISRAAKIAEERIAANDYSPDPDVQRELDGIMETAKRDLT